MTRWTFAGQEGSSVYDRVMVPRMFAPWAELLLDRLAVVPGEALLDVATGPGTVAVIAAGRGARATGVDLSPAMIETARSKGSPVEFLEGPAGELPVGDGLYDVVTCQQGLQFFPDQPRALAEMRRALRPGGRAGIAVWCAIEQCPPFDGLATAVGRMFGADAEAAYRGGPWGLPDGEVIAAMARDAGFPGVVAERHELPVVFEEGPAQLVATLAHASVGDLFLALDDDGYEGLVGYAAEELAPITEGDAVRSTLASNLVIATG